MRIACCSWALTAPENQTLRQIHELGFEWIDLQSSDLRGRESQILARELGLSVSCLGASFGMPSGASLDHEAEEQRLAAIQHVAQALEHGRRLGAETAYVIPCGDDRPAALRRYGDSMIALAEMASASCIKLCIEHFPGTALHSAADALAFLDNLGHPNLYLLYDSGHIQMANEDPEAVIDEAGKRLGYAHFDDNDGISDLHWALLDGLMTETSLRKTLRSLAQVGYRGGLSLELSPSLANPVEALARSRDILLQALRK